MDATDSNPLRIDLGDQQLEYRVCGPAQRSLILLHEGLGSAAQWRDFPERLVASTGLGAFAYSRKGYGASSPVVLPRPLTYMHEEAQTTLPRLLDLIGFTGGFLIGHSDGASIAAIYAGSRQDHRIKGLVLIAPHFFVEEKAVAAIAQTRVAYETTDLRKRLDRRHKDVDGAFRGWNDAWLDPAFRSWDIREFLPYIRVPMLIIQGEADDYGTIRQMEAAEQDGMCPVEMLLLPGIGHAPHRDAPGATVAAIASFVERVLALEASGRAVR